MRILMLTQFFPPIIGGEERHVLNLSKALASRGHDVTVATQAHPAREAYGVESGVKVHRLRGSFARGATLYSDAERRHAPPFPDPELLHGLSRLIAREKPDIVHAHNWLLHSFLPLKRSQGPGLVITLHDYSLVCARKNLMYRGEICSGPAAGKCLGCAQQHYGTLKGSVTAVANWASSLLERRVADRFVTVSSAVAEHCGLPGGRAPFEVLPNFIPDNAGELSEERDERLGALPPEGYILFVGDLNRIKGVPVLLEAYAKLREAPPLVLIGRRFPETPDRLPANVSVFESWPHASVMHAWSRCIFGVAPSIWLEPCCTVVLEANAVGKAMIATKHGGMVDLVADGESGLLVRPGDSDALADAMRTLIDKPDLRNRLAEASQKRVEKFMAKSIVPQIERVYQDVIAGRRGEAVEASATSLQGVG